VNLGEAPIQLVVGPVQNGLLDEEHVTVNPVRVLQPLHKGVKLSDAETVFISDEKCITYQEIR